ncbi:MAG: glutamate 5-kinase, partial [Nitrospinota bacterium]
MKASESQATQRGREALKACRRIVVKVGSGVLAGPEGAGLDEASVRSLVRQVTELRRDGRQVVLVSS